jgi:4-hydroxybenzoate polyprenyltransferase
MNLFRTIFWSSRPVSWINTAYPFALAYFLGGGELGPTVALGTIFFLIPYNALMYGVNDVYDYPSDLRNPRKGGVEGALIPPVLHQQLLLSVALLSLPFLIFLVVQGAVLSQIWLFLTLLFVIAYSAPPMRTKEQPVLDSITSSLHFVSPAIYGFLLTTLPVSAWWGLAAFFLWGMASHAFGAIQDIHADRQAGIASIATAWGARRTTQFVTGLYVSSGLLLLPYGVPGGIMAVLVWLYAANAGRYWRLPDDQCEQTRLGWRIFMRLNYFTGAILTFLILGLLWL